MYLTIKQQVKHLSKEDYCSINETFQRKVHIGKQNNQNFVNIPYGRLQNKLQYLCDLNGIKFVKRE